MKPERIPCPALFRLVGAFLFLSVLLNFTYPADHWLSWQILRPSIDCWLLFIVLAVAACCLKRRLLVWTVLPIYCLFLLLRLLRVGDTVVPMYLNRPLNLYIDSGYLLSVYDLLKTSSQKEDALVIAAGATVAVLGYIASSWYGWRLAAGGLADKRVRISFLAISGLLFAGAYVSGWHPAERPAIVRLYEEVLSARQQLKKQQTIVARMEETARKRKAGPASVDGLNGADVLLFMVESYGQIVYSRPQYRAAILPTMADFAEVLDRHGFKAVSSYLSSPTYGGISRLAHGTLEFGFRVENNLEYTALLRSSLPPLASYFRKSGYRTVSVMPGTRFVYPEGTYYGYEYAYYAKDFNYQGPTFGWAPMPDQFVLDYVHRHEFTDRKQPLFVRYVLISTHAAYSIQPPFIGEWDAVGDGGIYNARPPVRYPIRWPNLQNAGNAYLRSLDYEFTTLGEYFAKYVKKDTLIIIMGDHQPNVQLTGENQPWSVPVHIISRNPLLLSPFRNRGYTSGLVPSQTLPLAGMDTFLQDFLQDFR
ncbi:MAG: sulfatase-like hydrolase/transferase [Desulforhopalus sp.]